MRCFCIICGAFDIICGAFDIICGAFFFLCGAFHITCGAFSLYPVQPYIVQPLPHLPPLPRNTICPFVICNCSPVVAINGIEEYIYSVKMVKKYIYSVKMDKILEEAGLSTLLPHFNDE